MNKSDIVSTIAEITGEPKATISRVIDAFVNVVEEGLKAEDTVKVAGLGNFSVLHTAPRTGRNPATGEAVQIPAKRRVKFKASTALGI